MTRRTLLQLAPAVLSAQSRASKPNILFLMADQHRGDCLGADGNRAAHTPNLDRLAADGVRFTNAYSATPSCTPARACILTGMSPWNHGMLGYSKVAEKYPYELPRAMAAAGYHTAAIGKLHYSPQRNLHGFHQALLDESGRVQSVDFRSDYRSWFWSEAPGLDPDATGVGFNDYNGKPYVLPERLHPTSWTGDCAVRFLEGYQRPEPFLLKVSFARPHSPYDPPPRWWKRFESTDFPKPFHGKWSDEFRPRSWEKNDIWHGDVGEEETRKSRQGYYGSVAFIDEQIGRILATLEKRGWLEQTLIVYTSDHGDLTGDHFLWRKAQPYEASARIPMLMRWPKGMVSDARGRAIANPVELRDLFPTFLDAAGQSPQRELDGRSMLQLARNRTEGWRRWIDLEHDIVYADRVHWNALTDGETKYIFHALDGREQLFDLKNDRAESHDLAGVPEHEAKLRQWRSRMLEHLSIRGDAWVRNGKLAMRPKRILHSPNYPGGTQ